MENVFKFLEKHDIAYRMYEHPPVHTIRDAEALGLTMPGVGAKNLFLKNLMGTRFFLLVIPNTARADLKVFARIVSEKKVTFGTQEELMRYLGVTPGSVSLCGLLNDTGKRVEPYVHEALINAPLMHLHPNRNTASLELTKEYFTKFIHLLGHSISIVTTEQMSLEDL